MKLIDITELQALVKRVGLTRFNDEVIHSLERDFARWPEFSLSPRDVTYCTDNGSPYGVIELMPCSDARFYSVKYVNGHPRNTAEGKLSIVALGILADIETGYPLLFCEMTLLTAIRTAAVAALGAKYLAREDARHLGMIGTGAQAEFLVQALRRVRPVETISFYDRDAAAMQKFASNMRSQPFRLVPCNSIDEVVRDADILATATAARGKVELFSHASLKPGAYVHALGGDSEGKTELDPELLRRSKLVVEFLQQTRLEGEIQNVGDEFVHAELWEIVTGKKPGRENDQEITLFDAVGIALEDFSILTLVHRMAEEFNIGRSVPMLPALRDPKDLFSLIAG